MNSPITPIEIEQLISRDLCPRSLATTSDAVFFLAKTTVGKQLGILTEQSGPPLTEFTGEHLEKGHWRLAIYPLTHANANALRNALPWLRPWPLGLSTSAGCGDRLGLATPGHARAARAVRGIAMIFAQQSIREMSRTERTPHEVMDDATWSTFQGRAVPHTAAMYRHLAEVMAGHPFELDVSVDETETPTSHAEHPFIASELQRLGVRWVSLAPRYVPSLGNAIRPIVPTTTSRPICIKCLSLIVLRMPTCLACSISSMRDRFCMCPSVRY